MIENKIQRIISRQINNLFQVVRISKRISFFFFFIILGFWVHLFSFMFLLLVVKEFEVRLACIFCLFREILEHLKKIILEEIRLFIKSINSFFYIFIVKYIGFLHKLGNIGFTLLYFLNGC